eukprot:14298277-Alexandrium_andersonii.AAC.1
MTSVGLPTPWTSTLFTAGAPTHLDPLAGASCPLDAPIGRSEGSGFVHWMKSGVSRGVGGRRPHWERRKL